MRKNLNSFLDIDNKTKYDIAIHIRSLIDSPTGHQQFKEKKPEFYGWLISHISRIDIKNKSENPLLVYVASDNKDEINNV